MATSVFIPDTSNNFCGPNPWFRGGVDGNIGISAGATSFPYPTDYYNDTGLTIVIRKGFSLGKPHIDISFSGTTNGGPYFYFGITDFIRAPAANGQTWELSWYASMIKGPALSTFLANHWGYMTMYNSGGTSLGDLDGAFSQVFLTGKNTPALNARTVTANNASTAFVSMGTTLQFNASTSVDCIVRMWNIGLRRKS